MADMNSLSDKVEDLYKIMSEGENRIETLDVQIRKVKNDVIALKTERQSNRTKLAKFEEKIKALNTIVSKYKYLPEHNI